MASKRRKSTAAEESSSQTEKSCENGSNDHDISQVPSDPVEKGATDQEFPIVGIGASAGGLKALQQFFDHMPSDSGCAFVVIMHLSPDHESHLDRLLQGHTRMGVQQIQETVALEENCVYLIPPNANLTAIDSHVRLTELEPRGPKRAAIDHFFRSLPKAHESGIIGILLSGTGSDGTLGLKSIKEYNGLTIVQDPAEAEYSGMPQSAIAAATVDSILPVAEIPAAVLDYVKTWPQVKVLVEEQGVSESVPKFLQQVFDIVRARTGRDFANYKRNTMLRRIVRRMKFNHISKPEEYLDLMRSRLEETKALADDLLITVTNFFRDQAVYEVLEKKVVPELFEGKGPSDSIRVWSVGCATGEEPYSIAMLLLEEARRREAPSTIQIFASDLHMESLNVAREGFYPGDIGQDVGDVRLKHFFTRDSGCFRIRKEVRELVVFAPHNVLSDPPFSKIDLIFCRNMLIYLKRSLQQQVVELFHYALQESRFLVLGTSENIAGGDLFQVEDKKNMIYRKRKVPGPELRLPVFPLVQPPKAGGLPRSDGGRSAPASYGMMHQYIVEQYGPPSVLLSPDDNVVHSSLQAGRYLIHPGGPPTTNIFKIIREELSIELRTALSKVRREQRVIRTKSVPVRSGDELVPVSLDLRPAAKPEQDGFVLLIFNEGPQPEVLPDQVPKKSNAEKGAKKQDSERVKEVEAEKVLAEQRLQQLVEEHQLSQEEIKASNEELQSANEELRSTLEELETSREELQSTNEELLTLNQENRHKVEELDQLSGDLQNLLVATDIATLFLDRQNRIVRFTPKIEPLFNIRASDRGRALADFTSHLGYGQLEADISKVIEQLSVVEREVKDQGGRWYLARILPYRDLQDRISGTVVTFVDITRLKQAEEQVRRAKETSESIIECLPVPLLVLSPELWVRSANGAFYHHFEVESDETLGRRIYELGNRQWDIPGLRKLLEELLPRKEELTGYEVDHHFEQLGRRIMVLQARHIEDLNLILLGFHDITERRLAEEQLRESAKRKDEYLAMLGHELRNPLGAIRNAAEILRRAADPKDERLHRIMGVLYRQSTHMSTIIDGLLDVSRITRGKISLNLQPVDLRIILEGIIEAKKPDIADRDLHVEIDLPDAAVWVMGDEVRLTQVFENLFTNAIKFTPSPGTITVAAEHDDTDVEVRLRDTGEGIDPELLSSIFEPFQQGRQDVARTSGGLGLGLSLVKGILVLHQGTIKAHSDGPGTGAEFVIRLPLTEFTGERAKTGQADEVPRLVILVVDDNDDAILMIRELLESCGHEVLEAQNGQAALEELRRNKVDVVMSDLGMSGMDGYELARTIRSDSSLAELPLIAVTGYGQQEDRRRALEAGFDEHLTKPVDLKALHAALVRFQATLNI